MSITYKKHENYPKSILIRILHGDIYVEDLINSWKYMQENNFINDDTKGLVNDLRNCTMKMNMEDFKKLISKMENQPYLKKIKIAVVTENYKNMIFPIFGEHHEKQFKIKPFASMEAATKWVVLEG
jgi:hypothetical protein